MTGEFWFAETGDKNLRISYKASQSVFSGRSRFQRIDIIDTLAYGRMLLLDGVANSSENDEFIYHEVLVHPPMLAHPNPEKVCVIGGAEGATLREVYRHPSVKKAVMVDVDEELVALCRKYMPTWDGGAFDDPRTELHFGDGRKYLEETDERFDVIIIDLSDPLPGSPAVFLFTREFYRLVSDRLTDRGVVGLQGESLQPWRIELHARLRNTLSTVFKSVRALPYTLPCFHELHSVFVAAKEAELATIDFAGRRKERGLESRYFSDNSLGRMFGVPGYAERAYDLYTEVLTDQDPLTIFQPKTDEA